MKPFINNRFWAITIYHWCWHLCYECGSKLEEWLLSYFQLIFNIRSAGPLHVGPADHRDGPVRIARAGVLSSSASSCKRTVSRYAHDCEVKRLAIRLNFMCIIITGEIEWMIRKSVVSVLCVCSGKKGGRKRRSRAEKRVSRTPSLRRTDTNTYD